MSNERYIKFLGRKLTFPTDPTYREYRVVEDLTGVTAQEIMDGSAGIWMLPVLAIVALLRSDRNITREALDRILDLGPGDIELEGNFGDESPPDEDQSKKSTGTDNTPETPEESGTPDSPTSSQEPQENPTT